MSAARCYIIYDCPSLENDKQWLTDGLRQNGIDVVEIVSRRVQSRLIMNGGTFGKAERFISIICQCLQVLWKLDKNDVIICWAATCGVIFNALSLFMKKQQMIISMNWLVPITGQRSHMYGLQRKLFINPNAYIAVNAKSSIKKWCEHLSLPIYDENKFLFLPDVYEDNEPFIKPHDNRHSGGYIFAGGVNNRDWKKIVELAYAFPQLRFVCVALEEDWRNKVHKTPDNVEVYFRLPVKEYYRLMQGASLICLPLLEDRPSGLINILKAAQFGIICCTSDYEAASQYYGEESRDLLLGDDIEQWKGKIRELWKMERTSYLEKTDSFQSYIKREFSPDKTIRVLMKLIK